MGLTVCRCEAVDGLAIATMHRQASGAYHGWRCGDRIPLYSVLAVAQDIPPTRAPLFEEIYRQYP
ncbi:MAG: hypothetical protein KME14_12420 [Tildeniella torsiva UHER 1998/13D]|nr:hypothetical protein [Tildeniella torsiva UHER 1998/13D]